MDLKTFAKRSIQDVADRYGVKVQRQYDLRPYKLNLLNALVRQFSPESPAFFFIQVGANDGVYDDPIVQTVRRYGWRGLLLEPQPSAFRKLAENYADQPQLILENVAIAATDGEMSLWTIKGDTGLGTMNRAMLARTHAGAGDQIEELKVVTATFATLLRAHRIDRVDLLQIDTEGFDFEVIRLAFEAGLQPKLINYEHVHLSSTDQRQCVELLGSRGYRLAQAGEYETDTIAVLDA